MKVEYRHKSINALKHLKEIFENAWNFQNDLKCIELFSREGNWHTQTLFRGYSDVTLCEIDNQYVDALNLNFPNANIQILDSINMLKTLDSNCEKYDLVSVDNPLGCYGQYCENFEVVENIYNLLKKKAILLINIVPRPYNYINIDKDWQKRRKDFYNVKDDQSLSFNDVLITYKRIFSSAGYKISDYEYLCREYANDLDYVYYLCLNLEKS
jgi:16S rRNA G966 N2-methylase RsmD